MIWRALLLASTFAVGAEVFVGMTPPLRPLVVLWFLLICPGMAIVSMLDIRDGWARISIGIALSIALATVTSSVLLYAGAWSPRAGLLVLMGITLLSVGLSQALDRSRRRGGTA
jgi:hypothetical protein